jgi:hypothetical protein
MKRIVVLLVALMCNKLFAQVNLQSGAATFSIPVFNWQDDKSRLNAVVAMSYNSGSGLKTGDVASNIGQGWNLVAGGIITRMQVGEPDDQKPYNGNGTIEDITKYPAGYLYDTAIAAKGCAKALTRYPIFGDQNHLYKQHNVVATDKEMDYFSFQFNGFGGLFVLDKNNPNNCLSLNDNHMKIWFTRDETMATNQVNSGIRTTINAFYIQDENGLIYKFRQYGTTKVLKTGYCDRNVTEVQTAPHFNGGDVYHESAFDKGDLVNPYVINNWYLTEIEDGLTHRKITITYETRNLNVNAGMSLAYYSRDYAIISHHHSIMTTQEISSINYPDGHSVVFNYGNNRFDYTGQKALASVDILYNNRYLSEYQLVQSYFIKNRYGNPVSDYQKNIARLCLLSVKQVGVDLKADNQPYLFDYYLGSDAADDFVPPLFSQYKDIWGFYNGDYSRGASPSWPIPVNADLNSLNTNQVAGLCFKWDGMTTPALNAKPGYAKNGLLKQVIYPTGGTVSYEYQQNTAVLNGASTYVGGVHVSKVNTTDGGYQNGCDNPLTTQYNYVDASGNSSLWGLESPVNSMTTYNHYEPEYKYYHYKFPLGECGYHFRYPGIMSREEHPDLSDLQNLLQSPVYNTVSAILNVLGTVMDVANVIGGSTCFGAIAAVVIDIIAGLTDIVLTCFTNQAKDTNSTVYYNGDLNASNPLPVQFWRVEAISGTGGIGRTVQEFTRNADYPLWDSLNPAYSMKQRYGSWAYGLPKKTTVYDVANNKVKETENVYDFSNAKESMYYGKSGYNSANSCKCLVKRSYSQRNPDWSDQTKYNDINTFYTSNYTDINNNLAMNVEIYGMYKGRIQLGDSYERTYKPSNSSQYLESHTHYDYNPGNYQVNKITTTESNGDVYYKNLTYSSDYYDGSVLTTLNTNNIISLPVSSYTQVQKSGSSAVQYLGESVTEYTTTANGDIKPYRKLEQRFAQPMSNIGLYAPNNAANNTIYKQVQTYSYDGNANLTGLKDEGNHSVANIYDYNDKYVIASVINADASLDKPVYTSFERNNYFGGWQANGSISRSNYSNIPATGDSSFVLDGTVSFSSAVNSSKPYKLSFWSNGSSVNVNGGSMVKNAPAINGFTYYEYDIPQGTAAVTVSGSGLIDELRLYPSMARMRTITYDPLVGKTSECDENNRISYYEYDELGRLKIIKDENRNMLKMYEYNTVSNKQAGCPVTYYNHLITETFKKQDCSGTNVTGNEITYMVPAQKYTSTISQADADAKAENELNTNGQSYANANAGCRQIFYNTAHSRDYTTQTCAVGYKGNIVTYSVPANKYASLISQTDADSLAWKEIFANGQAYANAPATASCTIETGGIWEANDSTAQLSCGTGSLAGHRMVYMQDVNPNSATYNTWQWQDGGKDSVNCPVATSSIPVTGSSTINATFLVTLSDPSSGISYSATLNYSPSWYITLYNVPAGTYNVTVAPTSSYYSGYAFQIGTYMITGSGELSIGGVAIATNTDAVILIDPIGQIR